MKKAISLYVGSFYLYFNEHSALLSHVLKCVWKTLLRWNARMNDKRDGFLNLVFQFETFYYVCFY